jgi:muconate cycloisomerase
VRFEDGTCGLGETLPRPYVSGETVESVVADLRDRLWPAFRARPLPEDLSAALARRRQDGCLPDRLDRPQGGPGACTAAAALLGCASFDRLLRRGAGALDLPRRIPARVSGVLGSADPARTAWQLRAMRCLGLRDFKLKLGLGDDVDAENLERVGKILGRSLRGGRCTLRVDVNGAWATDALDTRAAELARRGVCLIEQPCTCAAEEFASRAARSPLPLVADESLVTAADADALLAGEAARTGRVGANLRISKNGGPLAVLELLGRFAEARLPVVLGCMVGETSILSAAQRRVLQLASGAGTAAAVRFVEGNYGRLLVGVDPVRPNLRFGWGGRLRPLGGGGLGVRLDEARLAEVSQRLLDIE